MYLRTTKRKNKDGSVVEYYQLAHNERHPVTRKPVAKIVHCFGRADRLDRDELVRLCRSIARVCGLAFVDPFEESHEDIEWNVFNHTVNLFNFDVDGIFYDTTTASFCIDREDEDEKEDENGEKEDGDGKEKALRKFGHAKEGTWSPQAVVALAVTNEGIPVRCWVFPGNTSDVDTVQRVRRDLRGWQLGRAMFVADSGMNSSENREELARACGKYLLACRMSSVSEIKREVLSKKGRYTVFKDNLQAKEVIVGEGLKCTRYILCYNPKEAKRQKNHRDEVVERLEK